MKNDELLGTLRREGTLRLGLKEGLACFQGLEPVITEQGMNGPLQVYAMDDLWITLEPVPGGDRVLRAYASRSEAEDFVSRRMDQFDRLWDGCGCRIDYDRRDPGW
ncbi:MAG: hypothetical protein AVO35_05870 [Candidatus Aegiribacteria sp. MLS_C]|nr:MAG: hypothetical protein AVO35_05870 [Candidatus Aegiribacteria sp. MLS_C]